MLMVAAFPFGCFIALTILTFADLKRSNDALNQRSDLDGFNLHNGWRSTPNMERDHG